MIILLTNDDGIGRPGLVTLARVLQEEHEVWVSAPESERSASSHAITMRNPVTFTKIDERTYACSGTPADCVLYGLRGALPVRPDVIISGINHGVNVGTDITYSGTFGAARQAAMLGIPAIAVSAEGHTPEDPPFEKAARFILERLEKLIDLWDRHTVMNVNVPIRTLADGIPWRLATLSHRLYLDELVVTRQEENATSYILSGGTPDKEPENHPDTDLEVLRSGAIAITPVFVHPDLNHEAFERLARSYRIEQERVRGSHV